MLIIGIGFCAEEVATIEPELARGEISSLELLNGDPMAVEIAMMRRTWPSVYPRPVFNGLTYGDLLNQNPIPTHDTILFIGSTIQL